jgi:membrane-bound ClpP family serine protease
VIVLGVILALIGFLVGLGILTLIGVVLLVCGLIALAAGGYGHPIGGRSWWW